jgi:hypothetical protein
MAEVTAATEHQTYQGTEDAIEETNGRDEIVADAAINQV